MIYIFDVDGTLTDEYFYDDEVANLRAKEAVVSIARSIQTLHPDNFFVVTARGEHLRAGTEQWLYKQGLTPNFLFMRVTGDRRPDALVRADQVRKVQEITSGPWVLFDDNLGNCQEVEKSLGVPCIHIR